MDNAKALLQADQVLLNQAVAEHQAGTAANLDELRARVQFQTQQQAVISAEVNFKKAKIALNREIGLPAEQEIQLTDTAPYADLVTMNIDQAKEIAYRSRQDYQGLQAQVRAAQLQRRAAKWERLPSLDFQGNYGVTGVSGVSLPWNVRGHWIAELASVPGGKVPRRQRGRGSQPKQPPCSSSPL